MSTITSAISPRTKTFRVTFFKLTDAGPFLQRRAGVFLPAAQPLMRIAKPMLLVMTPVGVGWGLVEAWRFHPGLAVLMALLVTVVGLFFWMTVRRIRSERGSQ